MKIKNIFNFYNEFLDNSYTAFFMVLGFILFGASGALMGGLVFYGLCSVLAWFGLIESSEVSNSAVFLIAALFAFGNGNKILDFASGIKKSQIEKQAE